MMGKKDYICTVDEFTVHVTRKKIKNMYLRVKESNQPIEVSAPWNLSEERIFAFVRERRAWICQAQERVLEREEEKQQTLPKTREEEWKEWTYLREEIQKLIRQWAPVMGVNPNGFKLRRMKTRWGSCNVKTHHMTFNLELAKVPYECLEYVVVHELSHLIEPSHNERFWRTMETYLPDAKKLRKELKNYTT